MNAAWVLYATAVSGLAALCAFSLDVGLRGRDFPLRWLWIGSMVVALVAAALPWVLPAEKPIATADWGQVEQLEQGSFSEGLAAVPSIVAGASTRLIIPGPVVSSPKLVRGFLVLWVLSSAAAFGYLLIAYLRLRQRRRDWRSTTVDGVSVLVSRDTGPAVVGLLKPGIVLPEWVLKLESERRKLVLVHEEEHLRAGDAFLLGVAYVGAALMPWNVPLWFQLKRLRHAVELDCDARVVRGTGDIATYGELLLEVGERSSGGRLGIAAFGESSTLLRERIMNIAGPKPARSRMIAGAALSTCGLILIAACEAPAPTLPRGGAAAQASVATTAEEAPEMSVESASEPVSAGSVTTEVVPEQVNSFVASERAYPLELAALGRINGKNLVSLVGELHPDLLAVGLPDEQAVWFAVDVGGRIRHSWVGPNLFLRFKDHRPITWTTLPEGSAQANAEKARHKSLVEQVLRENAPHLQPRSMQAVALGGNVRLTTHFFSEMSGSEGRFGWETIENLTVFTERDIAAAKLPPVDVERMVWQGQEYSSRAPERVIALSELREIGEVDGSRIFAEADSDDLSVVWRLEEGPNVFLPFMRNN